MQMIPARGDTFPSKRVRDAKKHCEYLDVADSRVLELIKQKRGISFAKKREQSTSANLTRRLRAVKNQLLVHCAAHKHPQTGDYDFNAAAPSAEVARAKYFEHAEKLLEELREIQNQLR